MNQQQIGLFTIQCFYCPHQASWCVQTYWPGQWTLLTYRFRSADQPQVQGHFRNPKRVASHEFDKLVRTFRWATANPDKEVSMDLKDFRGVENLKVGAYGLSCCPSQ